MSRGWIKLLRTISIIPFVLVSILGLYFKWYGAITVVGQRWGIQYYDQESELWHVSAPPNETYSQWYFSPVLIVAFSLFPFISVLILGRPAKKNSDSPTTVKPHS
jgi:hypothetical protein